MKTFQQYLTEVTSHLNVNPPFPTASGFYGVRCVSISGSKRECMTVINEIIKLVANEVFDVNSNESQDFISSIAMSTNLNQAIDGVMDFSQDLRGNEILLCWYDQEWKDDSQLESDE